MANQDNSKLGKAKQLAAVAGGVALSGAKALAAKAGLGGDQNYQVGPSSAFAYALEPLNCCTF